MKSIPAYRKIFWLLLAISLLCLFVMQWYFETECRHLGVQGAYVTMRGVICWYDLNGFRKNLTLEKLKTQHDDKLQMEACIKAHPDNKVVCNPGYVPPIPTFAIGTG